MGLKQLIGGFGGFLPVPQPTTPLATPVSVTNGGTGVNARPAFAATMSAQQSFTTANTKIKVAFDTVVYNVGGNFDTTNNRWKPISSGSIVVCLDAGLIYTDGSAAYPLVISIFKNGALLRQSQSLIASGGTNASMTISIQDQANGSTDYYEVFFQSSTTSGQTLPFGFPDFNWFSGSVQ